MTLFDILFGKKGEAMPKKRLLFFERRPDDDGNECITMRMRPACVRLTWPMEDTAHICKVLTRMADTNTSSSQGTILPVAAVKVGPPQEELHPENIISNKVIHPGDLQVMKVRGGTVIGVPGKFVGEFSEKRALQAAAVVLKQWGGTAPYERLLQVLYFADLHSMTNTGDCMAWVNPKSDDYAVAPSWWEGYISRMGSSVKLDKDPGDDDLSDFEVETLILVTNLPEDFLGKYCPNVGAGLKEAARELSELIERAAQPVQPVPESSYDTETRKLWELPEKPDPEFLETRQELKEVVDQIWDAHDQFQSFTRRFHNTPDWDEDYKVERHGFDRDTIMLMRRHLAVVMDFLEELDKGAPKDEQPDQP